MTALRPYPPLINSLFYQMDEVYKKLKENTSIFFPFQVIYLKKKTFSVSFVISVVKKITTGVTEDTEKKDF